MPTVLHDVQMVRQQSSPVCWLACAAMIIQYKRRYTPSAQQLGLRGEDFRTPGYTVPSESPGNPETYAWLRRLGFAVTTSRNLPRRHPPTMAPGRFRPGRAADEMTDGEEIIFWLLTNKGPFILNHNVGAFWYGPGQTLPAGHHAHAVVITGLETTAARSTVYFNNPWGTRNVATTTESIVGAWERWERSGQKSIAYLE